ncbi:MAG TPA: MlaD family protein [Phycisphaerae bacterium]|nr:MCE family protein [Phycisphaerales bacterium]HRX84746.1 MlaD family protein [Phycisphaerae bacterium]
MTEMRRNFLVGLFMVVGLGALGYLLVLFGEAPAWLGGAEWTLRIRVNEISGIEEGTPVYLNGIKVGRVTGLAFVRMTEPDQGVEIITQIENDYSVPSGSVAQCIGPALGVGRGRVDIQAHGAGAPIESEGVISGVNINPLDKILPESLITSVEGTVVKVGNFAETLTPVAKDLHELLKKSPIPTTDEEAARFTTNLYTAVQRFDRVLKSIHDVIGDPKLKNGLLDAVENIRQMSADGRVAFADFRDTSANLKIDASRLADKMEGTVDNIDRQVTRITDAAIPVLDQAAKSSANLRVITDNMLAGQGTIGRLLTDERLYEVMVLSLQRAQDAVDSLRRLFERFEKSGRIGLNVNGFAVERALPK